MVSIGAATALEIRIRVDSRYLVKVPNGTGSSAVTHQDFGAGGTLTTGIAIFNVSGTAKLYVGCYVTPIQELSGSTWTEGEAGTERGWLEVPRWTLGETLANGGCGPYVMRGTVQVTGKGRAIGIQPPEGLRPGDEAVLKMHPVLIAEEVRLLA